MRRNVNMVYIVENNGVYGLTKGQFSATAEKGLEFQHPEDIGDTWKETGCYECHSGVQP